ncbi:intermembrane transport protein PqiB [Thiocapsa sp.]|uniref:PqiB family protein n=1 Tax=Thiocapsa sp. TaxID=2024551 RepID=UPI003593F8BB
MSEPMTTDDLPLASLEPPRRRRASVVWIIPLLAAAVAIGIAVQRIMTEGPVITILFRDAAGVQAGKTALRYKSVDIGQVSAVALTDRFSKVQVTVKVDRSAEGLMVQDTRFWIVEPRVTLGGISGLGTLISGNYIGLYPGRSDKAERSFVGLDTPPPITDQQGRRFVLKAPDLGSLGIGAPLYFRRLQVGEVASYTLAKDGSGIEITVFVKTPYEPYVTSETRFWDASGIDVSLDADGLEVRTQSLVSILAGGVAFDIPSFASTQAPAAEGAVFPLYRDQASAMKQPDPVARRYVLYTDSMQGLTVGAPVKLLGLTAGEIASVALTMDPETKQFRPRVLVSFFPERLLTELTPEQEVLGKTLTQETGAARLALIRHQIEDLGLRATVRTGNLLTGERYIALDYDPQAPKPQIDWSRDPLEIPVTPSGLDDLESKLNAILDQTSEILATIDKLPLATIAATLDSAVKNLDVLIKGADAKTLPELDRTLEQVRRAMATADRVLKSTDQTLLGEDAPGQQELREALQEITGAARALRVFVDYLDRNPSALLRGKGKENP